MKERILNYLNEIEKQNNVKILFAVESGSREWGFSSTDSDYDVRCVHVAERDRYLSLDKIPEQIELLRENIDIVSWDIHKFFSLFLKSNPTVSEWLSSNMIYKECKVGGYSKKDLLSMFNKGFSRSKLKYHYISLAKQNYCKYIDISGNVLLKKYVYILRGLGCTEYIIRADCLPPLNWKLSSKYLPEKVKGLFSRFVDMKKVSEKARGKRNEILDKWIKGKLEQRFEDEKETFDTGAINDLVVKAIDFYAGKIK